jgi:hypothetical protein
LFVRIALALFADTPDSRGSLLCALPPLSVIVARHSPLSGHVRPPMGFVSLQACPCQTNRLKAVSFHTSLEVRGRVEVQKALLLRIRIC